MVSMRGRNSQKKERVIFMGMLTRVMTIEKARGLLLAVAFLVGSVGVFAAGVSSKADSGPITMKNWLTHPSIKQARDTVADVAEGMKSGKIRVEETVYDITSDRCEEHIVTISTIIGFDGYGTVRYYKDVHFVASESVGFSEYFLDKRGTTRFLYTSLDEEGWQNSRAYFDGDGNGVFSIEQIDGEYLKDRAKADDYVRFTSENIKRAYKIKEKCPVKSKKTLSIEEVAKLLAGKPL